MAKRPGDFSEPDKIRMLLWCDRHCCLCKKPCGLNIEVAHLVPAKEPDANDPDNGMPMCFECHAKTGQYNKSHPKGTKYKVEELKKRRDQVYDEFTRHLVPPIDYRVTQGRLDPRASARTFPQVSFLLLHGSDHLPVQVFTTLDVRLGERSLGPPSDSGHYAGKKPWRLNPRVGHDGWFRVPEEAATGTERLEVEVSVRIVDMYARSHELLPVGFVYVRGPAPGEAPYWYFEP